MGGFIGAHHVLYWVGLSTGICLLFGGAGIMHYPVHVEKWVKGLPGLPTIVGTLTSLKQCRHLKKTFLRKNFCKLQNLKLLLQENLFYK